MIERGDPKPIPESTDWGLLPMLFDIPAGLTPGVVPFRGIVFPATVARGPEPEIRLCGSKKQKIKILKYYNRYTGLVFEV